ncbi:F-box/kelch-repeat protein At1g26930-like [Durio zibethinus]|uniref:F-box/kelch-repeat protein At1g26930-like n=1 Tax=Durio zibethinus TaxID=66656 RepID=A0A6P5XXK8_DURZI|nr:F-box/kelch-repeat protein At1g26930-like [Durio zibethinus]XP_022732853.1 F-box/kelch-repeat protein At1g26930-like [Durio zibethinus]XP_022732854.1 F-box/kelch-repeat protein At1g26930-like [Durio zibethinus]XP_022732855.1 F-box/kelch-repeat protein At1g26930-like [Durio zibethinus]XP_022732857.1 F-box/kelch-repeat protein At1g26930-like [Durio zibethinus]XP_022732858.1 F-box/kelch-repeat protein At1g26930-like [Durio zibethinus]
MVENRPCESCLVFASSCQQETKSGYKYNGKRPLEFAESDGCCRETKLSKQSSDDSSSDDNDTNTSSPQESRDLLLPDSRDQSDDDSKQSDSSSDLDSSLMQCYPIGLSKTDLNNQSDDDSLSDSMEESPEERSEEDDDDNDDNGFLDSPEEEEEREEGDGYQRHAGDDDDDNNGFLDSPEEEEREEVNGYRRHVGDDDVNDFLDDDGFLDFPEEEGEEGNGYRRHAGDDDDTGFSDSLEEEEEEEEGEEGDGYWRHAGDSSSDLDELIQPIGRDNSISCLIKCSRSDYRSIACLNRSFRSLIRSGEIYKLRRQNSVIEHWVYFSRQLLQWEAFDPIRDRWMNLPSMPPNECFIFSDKESLAVGTELLVFGKEVTSQVIYRYSILTNSWTSGTSMNVPRCLFGSASLGEIAILAGGCDSCGNILSSAEMYNSETQKWETLPSMNKPRKMCSGVFMDKKFYVIGGIRGVGNDAQVLTCGEEYDLETRKWTEIPNMAPGTSGLFSQPAVPAAGAPPLVAVVNNQLYAADHADMEVKKYDKESKSWLAIGRLPDRAVSMNGWGLAFRACGDRLIVIGGPGALGEGFIEVNSWVPSEGPPEWNLLARRRSGNFVYNCAVMGC